jgi:hypothetical protein
MQAYGLYSSPVIAIENNSNVVPLLFGISTLYPQKLALTSPTSGGRLVSIGRSRTQATEFMCLLRFLNFDFFPKNADVYSPSLLT